MRFFDTLDGKLSAMKKSKLLLLVAQIISIVVALYVFYYIFYLKDDAAQLPANYNLAYRLCMLWVGLICLFSVYKTVVERNKKQVESEQG